MIRRDLEARVESRLERSPARALLGSRQLAKTPLARAWVIAPVTRGYPLAAGVEVLPVHDICNAVQEMTT